MLKMTTPPAGLPLTLDEVKAHLRVEGNDENTYLETLIGAAVDHVQNFTNRQIMRASFQLTLSRLPASIPLPRPPFGAITRFLAFDEAGAEVEFLPEFYTASDSEFTTLRGVQNSGWFAGHYSGAVITYTAGYESAAAVPKAIKQALLLIIGDLYENRNDKTDRFPKASEMLLNSYRVFNV